MEITGIELFAGGGGLALGLERAGIDAVAVVEIDHEACETLRHNRPHWNVIEADIHDVDFSEYKDKIDIVSGGAPCQAFSYAGKKLGFGDTRGTLFAEFARCIKETNPKMFLFENVRGLLSHDNGRTFATIEKTFKDLGYTIQKQVLNACYFGVGQKRERIIVIGIRNDLEETISFSYPRPDKTWTTLRDALKDCPKSEGQAFSENKRKVMELVPPGGCWVDLPEDVARAYMGKSYYSGGGRRGMARRIAWDEPCLTLTTSPSQKQTERCHPDETRPFTVREYARIQSFPDEWEFQGTLSEQYKQIGNAVPVEMARRVGVQMIKALRESESDDMKEWNIDFISRKKFKAHVAETIKQYGDKLVPYNTEKFNSNIVDPIKMVFDKAVYGTSWADIVSSEVFRQRDKSDNNSIGYFHQRIFQYIDKCHVPDNGKEGGWDVIVDMPEGYIIDDCNTVHKIYAEMKNKHNTMNSAASNDTFIKMMDQMHHNDDCVCMLVEAIALHSQNKIWEKKVRGKDEKISIRRIRRVSIDKFYEIVTGESDAFYQICMALPDVIQEVIDDSDTIEVPHDTVYEELVEEAKKHSGLDPEASMLMAMYLLGFSEYNGFSEN